MIEIKECPTCKTLKDSRPTPDGDEVCPNCGDNEMMDFEGFDKADFDYKEQKENN
ncbi:unnamed protein product [marine sediment metagenome]|uniref:Uncharacterized protein n=1 Tax=marine sediment metagenome TaxID=412755 RepID=X0VH42_9ZZZZ